MGGSASSQLDEGKCTYIRGKTEATINNFSPHYKRQYAVALFSQIRNEVEQHRDPQSQFLKSKPPLEQGTVLYEAEILQYAEDLKKWKSQYVVIKEYAVECFDNKEAYQKGTSPKSKILPTGGKVLTSEEEYNALSDKHFPDPIASSEKENSQPFVVVTSPFPVYLWHPYLRHNFFCFQDGESQKCFSTILDDCIRHQNHDFLKQTTIEAQAFSEAVQFFRQEKGQYGSWEMIIGSQTQILSNLVMEELLPSFQTDLLPKMKGKRNDRKRAWFGIVEETYNLVLAQVSEGFQTLQEDCRSLTKQLEGTIRSDMDQIVTSKDFLAGKIKATVLEPAARCCTENIQPFLVSILEELMGPVSSGFSEVRQLFEKEIDAISQNFQKEKDSAKLKENLAQLGKLPSDSVKMEPCYLKVNLLREQLQDLKSRFKFYHIDLVVQRAQNDMEELMQNAVYTFEQLLSHASKGDPQKMPTAIEKVKLRVLKQFDYDSSTIRKKIFQEALVLITMPTMQRTLASTCKPELHTFEQYIFADYTNVIQVENVYEEILFCKLLDEATKVIQEAASLKKHNLFEDSMYMVSESVSSLTDLKTPSASVQASPEKTPEPVLEQITDHGGESNEVFIEPASVNSEDRNAGTLPGEEQPSVKPPEKVLDAKTSGEERLLPEVENIIIAEISDKQESPVVTIQKEETEKDETSQEKSNAEAGETQKESKPQEASDIALGQVNEIISLLTVTIEVPADAQHQNIEDLISEGRIVEIEEQEEASNEMDNVEESKEDEAVIEETKHLELMEGKICGVSLGTESATSVVASEVQSVITLLDNLTVAGVADVQEGKKEEDEVEQIVMSMVHNEKEVVEEGQIAVFMVHKENQEVEEGQIAMSVESDSCKGSHSLKARVEEYDHVEATVQVQEVEVRPLEAEANDGSPGKAAEDANTVQETVGSDAVGSLEEDPDFVQTVTREELATEELTADVKAEPFTHVPSEDSQQAGDEPPVNLETPNSAGTEQETE